MYKYYNFSGSGIQDRGSAMPGDLGILRTNKSRIMTQRLSWGDVDDIDVSTIKEHAFFQITGVQSQGFAGAANDGTMTITRIEFLV